LPNLSSDLRERHRHSGLDPGSSSWIPAFAGMTAETAVKASLSPSPSRTAKRTTFSATTIVCTIEVTKSPSGSTKKEETMIKMCATAAFAVMLSITVVSSSYAGASCCDPARTGGVPQPAGAQTAGPAPVGASQPTAAAVPNNPASQGMAAFMGYGRPEGVRLSDLAPRGSCCANPSASCAPRQNAADQQPLQTPPQGCAASCCNRKTLGVQPTQATGQSSDRPIQAVTPDPRAIAPVSELGAALTASPVKAQARPKPAGSGSLW
jgi:hypothetical protein